MKALIIEDEYPAAERLQKLITRVNPDIRIVAVLDSVESAGRWFAANPAPDLIFSDIQLSDGLSFEIFSHTVVKSPIIFTTSYDEYAIKAFKLKSIDYLLKPVKSQELEEAIRKYDSMKHEFSATDNTLKIESLLDSLQTSVRKYKNRFLVKKGEQLILISQDQIAYFQTSHELVLLVRSDGKKFLVDYTLEQLEKMLDPELFFRINRQYIAHLSAIDKIHTYFNGKLKLELHPEAEYEALVSREKAPLFKKWMEGSGE
jgi:DNA-binding LytR/AlgR family response regulator